MSAQPPDSDHPWRLDQNGRWYYLNARNVVVYQNQAIPRTPGPAPNLLPYRPNVTTPAVGYQYRVPAGSTGGSPGVRNSTPQAPPPSTTGQSGNTPIGRPAGPGGVQSFAQAGGTGPGASRPIPIPNATGYAQQTEGRGSVGVSSPQSLPSSAIARSPATGLDRGQSAPSRSIQTVSVPAGRARGMPGANAPPSLPAAGHAQTSGIGRGREQLPANSLQSPSALPNAPPSLPTAGNAQTAGIGRRRGQVPAGSSQLSNSGSAQAPGIGRGRGQSPANSLQASSALPNAPPSLPIARNAQTSGVGRGRGQLLANSSQSSSALPNARPPATGSGRGSVASGNQASNDQVPRSQQQQEIATQEQRETLDEAFRRRAAPRQFFRLGKVFLSQHTEPYGIERGRPRQSTFNTPNNDVFMVAYGELVFTKVRRFIVVREGLESCSALAITTHNGRGAAQRDASEHGVVYTGAQPPPARLRGEGSILPTAIRIDPFNRSDRLHFASRVNYGKLYNIEHNVKVKPYGVINNQHMHSLITQWIKIFMGRIGNPAHLAFATPGQATLGALGFTATQIRSVANILSTRRNASSYDAVTSIARASAELQLASEDRTRQTVRSLANHVVELILAGMIYPDAVAHVKLIAANAEADDDQLDNVDDDEDDDDEDLDANENGENRS